jgi:hypothetical protein
MSMKITANIRQPPLPDRRIVHSSSRRLPDHQAGKTCITMIGSGTSIFLIAVGAVLRFAVTVTAHGFNIHTIGVILMVVGAAGLLLTLLWMTIWADRTRAAAPGPAARGGYVEREYPPTEPRY